MSGSGLKKADLFAVVAGCGALAVTSLSVRPVGAVISVLGALAIGAALPQDPFRAGVVFALPLCFAVVVRAGAESLWYSALLVLPVITVAVLAGVLAWGGARLSGRLAEAPTDESAPQQAARDGRARRGLLIAAIAVVLVIVGFSANNRVNSEADRRATRARMMFKSAIPQYTLAQLLGMVSGYSGVGARVSRDVGAPVSVKLSRGKGFGLSADASYAWATRCVVAVVDESGPDPQARITSIHVEDSADAC